MSTNENEIEFRNKLSDLAGNILFTSHHQKFLIPVVVSNCNGTGPWSFSDATVEYSLVKPCFPAFMWFSTGYSILNDVTNPECKRLICDIMEVMYKHDKCLKQLLNGDVNEEKIKCILAIHYFKPMLKDGAYFVDECSGFKKCPLCGKNIKVDQRETYLGNPSVWHGQADIVIQESIVKIHVECVESESCLEDEELDELDCSENMTDYRKQKYISQAIAETIVNAFVESTKQKYLFDRFIPSFLATERNITILLYNCKLDKLILSSEFPIWESDNCTLNMETLLFVWLALNNYLYPLDDTTRHIIDRTPESRFKDVVGGAYKIYLTGVSRPCKEEKEHEETEITFPWELEDEELIFKVKKESFKLFKALEDTCIQTDIVKQFT